MKKSIKLAFVCSFLALAALSPASAETLKELATRTHYHGISFARSGSAVLLLASHERQSRLHAPTQEVQIQWDERETLPFDRADQPADLATVQQQFARACGLMVEVAAMSVRPDMQIQQVDLPVLYDTKGVGEVGATVAQRFDLGPGEDDARLPGVEYLVVVARALVPRDDRDLVFRIRFRHAVGQVSQLTSEWCTVYSSPP